MRKHGEGYFFVIRNRALLFQILEIIEQTRVHNDNGAHCCVRIYLIILNNQDLHLVHVVLAFGREIHARFFNAVYDRGNEHNSFIL